MDEVGVDGFQLRVASEQVQQILAHPDEAGGAAGRAVEPPEELLPARLGGEVQGDGAPGVGPGERDGVAVRRPAVAPEESEESAEESAFHLPPHGRLRLPPRPATLSPP